MNKELGMMNGEWWIKYWILSSFGRSPVGLLLYQDLLLCDIKKNSKTVKNKTKNVIFHQVKRSLLSKKREPTITIEKKTACRKEIITCLKTISFLRMSVLRKKPIREMVPVKAKKRLK